MHLGALDTVAVRLERLVAGCVDLLLHHLDDVELQKAGGGRDGTINRREYLWLARQYHHQIPPPPHSVYWFNNNTPQPATQHVSLTMHLHLPAKQWQCSSVCTLRMHAWLQLAEQSKVTISCTTRWLTL